VTPFFIAEIRLAGKIKLLAKLKILYIGFRATLNFQTASEKERVQ